jgi:DNA polymerase-3 subunit delta
MPALDFDALLRSVPKGDIAPAYYFYGDQDLLKDEALALLLSHGLDPATRDFNLDRWRAGDLGPEEFQSLALTPPLMAARRALVISDVDALQQKRARAQALRTAMLGYLARPAPETLLVLVQSAAAEKPDPDFLRHAAAVDFRALKPDRVRKWIRHRATLLGLVLGDDAVAHLYDVIGDDLVQIASELAKLASAVGERAATAADVADLVGVRRGETVHDFVDAVTGRRFAAAAGMLPHLLNAPGQSAVRLVTALGTALTAVAFARARLDAGTGAGGGGAAYDLKQAFFAARPPDMRDYDERATRWANDATQWTLAELESALAALLKADRRLKSGGTTGEAEIVAEAILSVAAAGVA